MTTRRLDTVRALRLRRRDAGDLALMRVDQMERDATVVGFTSRLLAGLVRTGNIEALRQALPEALPWSTFLPVEDVDTLLSELVDTASGAVALDNLAPIALLLTQWRHSAEIYADPALLSILTREPEGDLDNLRRHRTPEGNRLNASACRFHPGHCPFAAARTAASTSARASGGQSPSR